MFTKAAIFIGFFICSVSCSNGHAVDQRPAAHPQQTKKPRAKPYQSGINRKPPPGLVGGLPNVGNTCYINAALQAIATVYPNAFRNSSTAQALSAAAVTILDKTARDTETPTSDEMKAFQNALCTHDQQFVSGAQEDAALLFEKLHGMMGLSKVQCEEKANYHLDGTAYEEKVSATDEWCFRAARPSATSSTMHQCIEAKLKGSRTVRKNNKDITQNLTTTFKHLPSVLPIHVTNVGQSPYSIQDADVLQLWDDQGKEHTYDLAACILYSGNGSSGHYTACAKKKDTWRYYNDDAVSVLTVEKAFEKIKTAGYIFFYKERR